MSNAALSRTTPFAAVALNRLLWVAPFTIAVAVAANSAIYFAADALFGVTWQPLFTLSGVIGSTVAYLLVATIAFAVVARFSKQPFRLYRRIAAIALLASFLLPLSALLGMAAPPGSGTTAAPPDTFVTMLVMHVVAYAFSVSLLTRLTRYERTSP